MNQRQRVLSAGAFVLLIGPMPSNGQYVSEIKNEREAVTWLHFSGDSDWLAAQKDPGSHWHRHPELEGVTLNNFRVSREALQYVLSISQLRALELGIGPEGIEIDPRDLELLGQADHLDHLGLFLADVADDYFRFLPKMAHLETLEIGATLYSRSQFTDELAHLLVATPKLRRIRVYSDEFTDEFVRILSTRSDLESLEMGSPNLTDASLALIGKLPALRKLRIRAPLITDQGVAHLRDLALLEDLEIESPKLGSGSLTLVSGLVRLNYLELSLSTVRREDLESVRNLRTLKILALRTAAIGDEEFFALQEHPSLESLFFERSQPTERSLPVIESMAALKNIALSSKTEATRHLLDQLAKRGIKDLSFYPKSQ